MKTNDHVEWHPGSFTKNFSWGSAKDGLLQLHESIKLGFAETLEDVPRAKFTQRVKETGRPEYIPANFFLFSRRINGTDYIIVDELVFQALSFDHSTWFDKLAVFAFNLSYAGRWKGAKSYQRRPAPWAYYYIKNRLAEQFHWDASLISADDIENFIREDSRYKGQTTRKLATNLSYMYSVGGLSEFSEEKIERWWVDAVFLTLDRVIEDRALDGLSSPERSYSDLLVECGFHAISGPQNLDKDLATSCLINLYIACGGRNRFDDTAVKARTKLVFPDKPSSSPNDLRPRGAVYPKNPRVLKSIPRPCEWLAQSAEFEVVDAEELADFNIEEFVKKRVKDGLASLQSQNISPRISAEALRKIMRG